MYRLISFWHPNHEKGKKRMRQLINKTFKLGSLLILTFSIVGCSVSMDKEPNPKTMDFTGKGSIGADNSFDLTNGVEINSDYTGDHLDDRRMETMKAQQHARMINSDTMISLLDANQVKQIEDVSEAIILETDNNAFVAIRLKSNADTITDELRIKITQMVKANVEYVEAVHIANNPEFFQKMETYQRYLRSGKPTSEYIYDFSETIRRIFPDAR